MQAEGGVNVASPAWLRGLAELAAAESIPLIVDDIQVGCGRTGHFFSFERAGIRPDIICISKAIGGIGMPMALTLIKPELDVWAPGDHTGTFRGNNLAFVAAAAALDYWGDGTLEAEVARHGDRIHDCLAAIAARHPGHCCEVRGIGMIRGSGLARRIPRATQSRERRSARGLIVETCGPDDEVTKVLPPLVITTDELEQGLSILSAAADEVAAQPQPLSLDRGMRQVGSSP